jgi:hypothetical protein
MIVRIFAPQRNTARKECRTLENNFLLFTSHAYGDNRMRNKWTRYIASMEGTKRALFGNLMEREKQEYLILHERIILTRILEE